MAAFVVILAMAAGTALAGMAGFFSTDPVSFFGDRAKSPRVAAAFFSGDMGMHFGMGNSVPPKLAATGLRIVGFNSPTLFARHRSRPEVARIIANAVTTTIDKTGADRIILIGQSFGSDILASEVETLPENLRKRIAAIVLVVPGHSAFFRADPTGLYYHGTPDALPGPQVRRITWAPVVCIYGARETDSLCPELVGSKATVIELPGNHYLNWDADRLTSTILKSLQSVAPKTAGDAR